MPKSLITKEGRVAVLLGVGSRTLPRHFSTPYGEVMLVTVKPLLPSELAYLLEHGADGQAELARRFADRRALPYSPKGRARRSSPVRARSAWRGGRLDEPKLNQGLTPATPSFLCAGE